MVIGPTFVWLHLPKCAGTQTESALQRIFAGRSDIFFDEVDPGKRVIWHQSVHERAKEDANFALAGREVICNFRRLPSWVRSRIAFENKRRPDLTVTRRMAVQGRFYENNGKINAADTYVKKMSGEVTTWLRVEAIGDDFVTAFQRHADLDDVDLNSLFSKRLNSSRADNVAALSTPFTEKETLEIYRNNPVWASIENKLYGNLLCECELDDIGGAGLFSFRG